VRHKEWHGRCGGRLDEPLDHAVLGADLRHLIAFLWSPTSSIWARQTAPGEEVGVSRGIAGLEGIGKGHTSHARQEQAHEFVEPWMGGIAIAEDLGRRGLDCRPSSRSRGASEAASQLWRAAIQSSSAAR
jgi:hypothetical protein